MGVVLVRPAPNLPSAHPDVTQSRLATASSLEVDLTFENIALRNCNNNFVIYGPTGRARGIFAFFRLWIG